MSVKPLGTCAGVLAAVRFYVLPPGRNHAQAGERVTALAFTAARLRDDC